MFSKEPNSERNDILTKILEKEIKTVCLKITYALTNIAIKLRFNLFKPINIQFTIFI